MIFSSLLLHLTGGPNWVDLEGLAQHLAEGKMGGAGQEQRWHHNTVHNAGKFITLSDLEQSATKCGVKQLSRTCSTAPRYHIDDVVLVITSTSLY